MISPGEIGTPEASVPDDVNTSRAVHRIRDFTNLYIMLFALWLMLTSSLDWQELAAGAVVCLAIAAFLSRTYAELDMPPITPRRIWFSLVYLVVLLVAVIKANLDVAYRILHPGLPIEPGIVVIRTGLKHDMAKMILANSITLTPGTFTLDIIDDKLLIHWIVVRERGIPEATALISSRFERYLKEIFE